jgi:uncharacterized membrane protein YfcA
MLTDPTLGELALMAATVVVAYTVLGFSGFGAVLVALPVLAHLLSLRVAVPVLLVSDLVATSLMGVRNRALIDRPEIIRLLPWFLGGMLAGLLLLSRASEQVLLTALGVFVISLSLWNLFGKPGAQPVSPRWAWPAGLVGGTFSSLFGTGGAIYTLYLARRLPDTARLRATVGALVLGSAVVRIVMFTGGGFFKPAGVLQLALTLLPFAVAGCLLGTRLQARLPQQKVRRFMWTLLVFSGASVLWRGLTSA